MSRGRMERVKAALRTREELCTLRDLYGDHLANGRNDVSVLRSRGWEIAVDFRIHEPGKTAHCHYRLIADGERPTQMALVTR